MLDQEGNIEKKQDCIRVILEDIDLNPAQVLSVKISQVESNMVDLKLQLIEPFGDHWCRLYNRVFQYMIRRGYIRLCMVK